MSSQHPLYCAREDGSVHPQSKADPSTAPDAFGLDAKTDDLTNEETRERLRRFLEALVEWSERVSRPATVYERSR